MRIGSWLAAGFLGLGVLTAGWIAGLESRGAEAAGQASGSSPPPITAAAGTRNAELTVAGYRHAISLDDAQADPSAFDYVKSRAGEPWYSSRYPHTWCGETLAPMELIRQRQAAGVLGMTIRAIPNAGVQVWDGNGYDGLAERLFPTTDACQRDLDNLDPSRNPEDPAR